MPKCKQKPNVPARITPANRCDVCGSEGMYETYECKRIVCSGHKFALGLMVVDSNDRAVLEKARDENVCMVVPASLVTSDFKVSVGKRYDQTNLPMAFIRELHKKVDTYYDESRTRLYVRELYLARLSNLMDKALTANTVLWALRNRGKNYEQ